MTPGAQERAATMVEQAVAASFTGLRTQSEVVALMLAFATAEVAQARQEAIEYALSGELYKADKNHAIAQAVRAERERCAMIIQELDPLAGAYYTALLRARPESQQ